MSLPLTDRALPERIPPWGVLILESHHSPDFEMEWRTHRFLKIVLVLHGGGTFYLGSRAERFVVGDLISVTPGIRNRVVDDPASAASLYVCCIQKAVCRFSPGWLERLSTGIIRGDGHFVNRAASTFRRLIHAQQLPEQRRGIAMVSEALKLLLLVDEQQSQPIDTSPRKADPRRIVQAYIDSLPTRYFEETTIDAAAARLGISRRKLTRLFTELTGQTWLNYIRGLAIAHARHRLETSSVPITSIAFECGFNDLSTFYRQFKQHCGVAPGHYRSRLDAVQRVSRSQQNRIADDSQ